jgi:hypothetical protein
MLLFMLLEVLNIAIGALAHGHIKQVLVDGKLFVSKCIHPFPESQTDKAQILML